MRTNDAREDFDFIVLFFYE